MAMVPTPITPTWYKARGPGRRRRAAPMSTVARARAAQGTAGGSFRAARSASLTPSPSWTVLSTRSKK